jgi:DNA-directed RNA polymerase specialized sigma24 family protein
MLTPLDIPIHANSSDQARASDARLESLVAQSGRGDREGFSELVAATEPRIRRLLGRLACQGADLDHLVQETYLRAWRSRPRFRGESRFSTWLFRIATNVARTFTPGLTAFEETPPP